MAFPAPGTPVTTDEATGVTTHPINVGSPSAGTLLLIFMRINTGGGTVGFTGYTQLGTTDSSDASNDETLIWYRWADGSEGASDDLTTTNSCKIAAICWKVTGAINPSTQPPQASTVQTFTTAADAADPANLTPTGGAKDYLWFALAGVDQEVGSFTAAPTNYTGLTNANTGTAGAATTNVLLGGATRQLNAASENPGNFTHAGAVTGGCAFTVVVHPTAGGTNHAGASSATLSFSSTSAGTRNTYGVSTGTVAFASTTAGIVGAKGSSASTIAFAATTAGTRNTYSASTGSINFAATTTGLVGAKGSSTATISFTATSDGAVVGAVFGSSTATLIINATSSGNAGRYSASTATIVFGATTDGDIDLGLPITYAVGVTGYIVDGRTGQIAEGVTGGIE